MKVAIIEGTQAEILEVLRELRPEIDAVSVPHLPTDRPSPAAIFAAVSAVTKIDYSQLSGGRSRDESYARHLTAYLLRLDGGLPLVAVSRLLGRDHSTIHMAVERIEAETKTRPETLADVEACRTILAGKAA